MHFSPVLCRSGGDVVRCQIERQLCCHSEGPVDQRVAGRCDALLPELIRLTAEYASARGADFDERCLDVPWVWGRVTPRDGGDADAVSLSTISSDGRKFVWVVGKSTFAESGLGRWSVRLGGMFPIAAGVSTLTVEQARAMTCDGDKHRTEEDCAALDPTGVWFLTFRACLMHDRKQLCERMRATGQLLPDSAAAAARALAEEGKALTPIEDFAGGMEGSAGLELHFEVDLPARTLRLQLYLSLDAQPLSNKIARYTPSEVLTVPLPADAAPLYRPALLIGASITVTDRAAGGVSSDPPAPILALR